jgi:anti-anti-sigma regulatory factor
VFRITRLNPGEQPAVLKLEGRLSEPWVGELARVIDLSANGSGRVVLELSGVTYADEDGVRMLRALDGRRAELRGGSPFVVNLVRGEGR